MRKSVLVVAAALGAFSLIGGASAASAAAPTPPSYSHGLVGPTSPPSTLETRPGLQAGQLVPASDGSFAFSKSTTTPRTLLGSGEGASSGINAVVSPQWTYAWNFTGDFQASLNSSKFQNVNDAAIHIENVQVSNCTSGYPKIWIQLIRYNFLGVIVWTGANVGFPCGGAYGYSWGAQPTGSYALYFSRSGPAGIDENLKHVTGTAYYG